MKYRLLSVEESHELISKYYKLAELIDEVHTECISLLQRKYQEYLLNFNPNFLWIFTRKQLSFEEFVTQYDDLGLLSIEDFSNKKYLVLSYFFPSNNMNNSLKLSTKEKNLIDIACKFSLNLYKDNNKYINRINRYSDKPMQFEDYDFDKFEKFEKWTKKINEVYTDYKKVP